MAGRRTAVLISGRGSNMAALAAGAAAPGAAFRVVLVAADREQAPGLAAAAAAGLDSVALDRAGFADRAAFEAALEQALADAGTELVCLAGFMRVLSAAFVLRWRDRLLNVHPSLLPAFPGLDTHARALAAGALVAGCTVHLVRTELDTGPILAQGLVRIAPGDTPAQLARRVLALEHEVYPWAVQAWCDGRLRLAGERVVAADAAAEAGRLRLALG